MADIEKRLRQLPDTAEKSGITADERLRQRILHDARAPRRSRPLRYALPALAAVLVIIAGVLILSPHNGNDMPEPLGGRTLGNGPQSGQNATGNKNAPAAGDIQPGAFTLTTSRVPSYTSIWASGNGANFPLICADGRYYRLLTAPSRVSSSLLGTKLGSVSVFTDEPALAGTDGIISNIVPEGTEVYRVSGSANALLAADVNGAMRVFQRVTFADSALLSGETLSDTLGGGKVVGLQLSGTGTVDDAQKAKELTDILLKNASYLKAGTSETDTTLILVTDSGLSMQMFVSGDRLMACGTWDCPEFFEVFNKMLEE